MEIGEHNSRLDGFEFEGVLLPVEFVETTKVAEGVKCDVYKFIGEKKKDLGIVKIEPGCKTPLQKVLKGEKTIEGYVSGSGKLTVTRKNGEVETFDVVDKPTEYLSVLVDIGDKMQWEASPDSKLLAYEVCFPPYEDGRFENLSS